MIYCRLPPSPLKLLQSSSQWLALWNGTNQLLCLCTSEKGTCRPWFSTNIVSVFYNTTPHKVSIPPSTGHFSSENKHLPWTFYTFIHFFFVFRPVMSTKCKILAVNWSFLNNLRNCFTSPCFITHDDIGATGASISLSLKCYLFNIASLSRGLSAQIPSRPIEFIDYLPTSNCATFINKSSADPSYTQLLDITEIGR